MPFIKMQKNHFLLTVLALSVLSSSCIAAITPAAPHDAPAASPFTTADHLIGEAQRQIDQIGIIFVTLSGIISSKQVTLANKSKVLGQLRSISSFIHELHERKFADTDIPLAYEFLHMNHLIMIYALEALNNNFTTIEKTSLDSFVKSKPSPAHVDIHQTTQLLMQNQDMLSQLTYKIDNFGLRWYNRAYRILDDYIISPCHRHSVPRRALLGTASVTFGLYLWWRLGTDSFIKYAPAPIVSLFGRDVPREPGMQADRAEAQAEAAAADARALAQQQQNAQIIAQEMARTFAPLFRQLRQQVPAHHGARPRHNRGA